MKKQSIQTIAKRFFLGNLLTADKVEVKYTGVDKYNQLTFNVKYSNPSGNTFTLSVLDENGESIFKSYYGDKQFDKTFKLPKSEVSKLTFIIEDGKESLKQKFDVSVKTQVIEDVVVSKG